jgi:acetylornithine deacetylase/succinyl-diaminopimelate desuccinylase-like protein
VSDATAEVTDLLQRMIRNECVNDGTADSGHEVRNVDLIESVLAGSGLPIERYQSPAGRVSLVTRIEGSDPQAPTLMYMAHTDVVPVNLTGWKRDPFAAELVDGVVWGRGAVDMLNMTASMTVAMRRLAKAPAFRPKGTLIFLAVADEEAGGNHGAAYLAEHETDAVRADYVITEAGGFPMPSPAGVRLPVLVAEKAANWSRLRIRGTPGHGSMTLGTDNALVKAAEVVRRIAEYRAPARITDTWRQFIEGMSFPAPIADLLLDPERIMSALDSFPPGMRRWAHACTHNTFAPTVMRAGTKVNIIADDVQLDVDIRSLPGYAIEDTRAMLRDALGDMADQVEIVSMSPESPSESPVDTPLWDALQRVSSGFYQGSKLVPLLMQGTTDARFFRRMGIPAYGFSLFSQKISLEDLAAMGHGDNERIDVDSLTMATGLWEALARDFLAA